MWRSKLFGALLLIGALLFPTPAHSAWALVNTTVPGSSDCFGGTTTCTITLEETMNAGNLVVLVFAKANTTRTVQSVTDSAATSYTCHVDEKHATGSLNIVICSAVPSSNITSLTVTINLALSVSVEAVVYEFSGEAASPFDAVSSGETTTGQAHGSGNLTTTVAGDLLVGGTFGTTGTWTIDADFAQVANTATFVSGWDEVGAAGTYSMDNTSAANENGVTAVAAFLIDGGGGGTPACKGGFFFRGIGC